MRASPASGVLERLGHDVTFPEEQMRAMGWIFSNRARYEQAQKLGRIGQRPMVRDGRI
jgi:hypothetical protein